MSTELTATLLNGRPISDIVTEDTPQTVAGSLVYAAGALHVDVLSVYGRVGGVKIDQLALYEGDGKLRGRWNAVCDDVMILSAVLSGMSG